MVSYHTVRMWRTACCIGSNCSTILSQRLYKDKFYTVLYWGSKLYCDLDNRSSSSSYQPITYKQALKTCNSRTHHVPELFLLNEGYFLSLLRGHHPSIHSCYSQFSTLEALLEHFNHTISSHLPCLNSQGLGLVLQYILLNIHTYQVGRRRKQVQR